MIDHRWARNESGARIVLADSSPRTRGIIMHAISPPHQAPFQPLAHAVGGIPNWTTDHVEAAGQLHDAAGTASSLVLAAMPFGDTHGYGSVVDATAAACQLTGHGSSPAAAIVEQGGNYFLHPVWTLAEHAGAAGTRLAGLTVTSFMPLQHWGTDASVTSPYAGVLAVIAGAKLLQVTH
jgi:hypothetical protein